MSPKPLNSVIDFRDSKVWQSDLKCFLKWRNEVHRSTSAPLHHKRLLPPGLATSFNKREGQRSKLSAEQDEDSVGHTIQFRQQINDETEKGGNQQVNIEVLVG